MTALSQGVDIRGKARQNRMFIGFSLNPSQSGIDNSGIKNISGMVSSKKMTFSGSVDFGFRLNENFALTTGLGFSSFSSQLELASYKDSLINQKDQDNDTYIRRISGENISEAQNLGLITIPVLLSGEIDLNDKLGLYLQTGLYLALPLSKKYESEGTMTYAGYYPAYKVQITGIIHEGFAEHTESTQAGTLEVASFIPIFASSGGVKLSLNDKVSILAGFFYNKALGGISGYSSADNFHLSLNQDEMNSMMAGSSKVSAQAMGLRLGLRYYIK